MGTTLLEVVTPATLFDLTTLQRVKTELEIEVRTHDTYLRSLISEASSAISHMTDIVFAKQQYKESIPGEGDYEALVSHRPVLSVDEVLCDNVPLEDVEIADADAGILYRRGGFSWTVPFGAGANMLPRVGCELPLYVITYTAGFVLPGWDDTSPRTLPSTIERAAVITVAHWYGHRGQTRGVKTKKVGDLSITYDDKEVENEYGIPLRATALLPRLSGRV
jgi:hypothetical protein